jgi:hypothetical protein
LHQISEFSGLDRIYNQAKEFRIEYRQEVPHLRGEILREGVFCIHKAVHVCGAAITHVDNGILSWSLTSAYQSSFFSLKGILCLLGLSFPLMGMKNLMVDCFPEQKTLSRSHLKKYGVDNDLKFLIFDKLNHKHFWEILQRVIRVTDIDLWDENISIVFSKIDSERFGRERNSIHYRNNYWPNDDLFKRNFDDSFAIKRDMLGNLEETLNSSSKNLSFYVCYLLLSMAIILIKDLGINAKSINSEHDKIIETLSAGDYRRLFETIPVEGIS